MPLDSKSVNRVSAIILILTLIALAFFLLQPILLSIVTGLILAYVVNPLYLKINSIIKRPTLSAFIVSIVLVVAIFIPLWFLIPLIIRQVFEMFAFLKIVDVNFYIDSLFSSVPKEFGIQISGVITNFLNEISVGILNWLSEFLLNLPDLLLQGAVLIFVFFFALRDQDKLKSYVSELSPLNKVQERLLIKEFKGITSSIVYGYLIIGIIQGIATGIGLFVFGVPNALLLTVIAVLASMFPLFGPWVVWLPVAFFLFSEGGTFAAIAFTIYGALVVSSLDNILRPYIVSKNSSISPVIALIGMIGGLLVFGLIGLILGPLILAYLVIFLTAYKNKRLSSMFSE